MWYICSHADNVSPSSFVLSCIWLQNYYHANKMLKIRRLDPPATAAKRAKRKQSQERQQARQRQAKEQEDDKTHEEKHAQEEEEQQQQKKKKPGRPSKETPSLSTLEEVMPGCPPPKPVATNILSFLMQTRRIVIAEAKRIQREMAPDEILVGLAILSWDCVLLKRA